MSVEELRRLLSGGREAVAEFSGDALGFGEALSSLFPDGVLRLSRVGTESADLCLAGTAATVLADGPVPVRVVLSHDGTAVTSGTLSVEVPSPGVRSDEFARALGMRVPRLPGPMVDHITLAQGEEGAGCTATCSGGRATVVSDGARVFAAETDGWRVISCERDMSADQLAVFGVRADGGLGAGTWLVLPGGSIVAVRDPLTRPRPDPLRVDGLGRVMPARTTTSRRRDVFRGLRAVPTGDGFAILGNPAPLGGLGWSDIGMPTGANGVSIDYEYPPLRIAGALTALPASDPYKAIIGGVLLFSFDPGKKGRGVYGTGMGAYVVPNAGTDASFFAFASIGTDPGIGIPALRLRGVAAGMGWNSRIRVPAVENIDSFPFIQALNNPGAIGAENEDPVEILRALATGSDAWITPAQGELWVAAGLAFSVVEAIHGNAMAIVQTGPELTIALMGIGGVEYPKDGDKKYAKAEIGLQAVIKPHQGELSIGAALTPSSFLLDPNCRLRGGVSLKVWYGNNPRAGDFVFSIGGYHPSYQAPVSYPRLARVGFDWALGGNVTISGSAYFAISPTAVMVGGGLDVRFHAGPLRAWCLAKVDALIQWKPFYFDVGLKISIGVSASIKILFVRITITIEVGVSLQVWGPPTGGEAKVHLWFISFTIDFGQPRDKNEDEQGKLPWSEVQSMLPPPESAVRVTPGPGLIETGAESRRADGAWEVSAAGFSFTTDSAVPVTALYLNTKDGAPAESGSPLNIRPMQERGRTSVQWVSLTRDGERVDLTTWSRTRATASVPQALWGTGDGKTLPSKDGDQVVPNQLTGVRLSSPPLRNGTSTGYISEQALKFDPIYPEGRQPLNPADQQVGAEPVRPGGVIAVIAATVAASAQTEARDRLLGTLTGLGLDLGEVDTDLSAYARAARTAFTAEPMLVPAA